MVNPRSLDTWDVDSHGNNMKVVKVEIVGQFYLLPMIKVTHSRWLNGDLELCVGWGKWEIVFGI